MKKYLFYLMQGEKMCALHALMNAKALSQEHEVKIIFEGKSVSLPEQFEKEGNPLYKALKDKGLIAGVCRACAKVFDVEEVTENLGLKLLSDMNGHAGMKPFIDEGYETIVF